MSETKLKPCPFCGGEAYVVREGSPRQSHDIACEDCGCRLSSGETFNKGNKWNTRTDVADEIIAMLESEVSDETA